jgi:hypothetical protein
MNDLGTQLVAALGAPLDDGRVKHVLESLGMHWLPETSKTQIDDWLKVGNVELGFEDADYFNGRKPSNEPAAPVLFQVCFFEPEPDAVSLRQLPPLGLNYSDRRDNVRKSLAHQAQASRLGRRDVFEIGDLTFVVGYRQDTDGLDTLLVLHPSLPRASLLQPPLLFTELQAYMGRPWYDSELRSRLYSLTKAEGATGQIKRHGTCDLVRESGVRLLYEERARTWHLCGAEIFRSRVREAATWVGGLPFGLAFDSTLADITAKLGSPPQVERNSDLDGYAWWTIGEERLLVTFDWILNLISSMTLARASYWVSDDVT